MAKVSKRTTGPRRMTGAEVRPAEAVPGPGRQEQHTPQKTRPGRSVALVKRGALAGRPFAAPAGPNGSAAAGGVNRPPRRRMKTGMRHPQIAERIASATE